jgi:hypothetical protein
METVIPGLLASAPQPLPFAPTAWARAFLLERDRGNLLIYSVGELEAQLQAIGQRSRISRQYLNHHHEAEIAPRRVDRPARRSRGGARAGRRQSACGNHLHGAPRPRRRLRSDPNAGTHERLDMFPVAWVAAVLESSDRAKYIESLELIRELDFELLVPWNATAGQAYHAVTDRSDARRRIEAILKRVTHGQDR